MATTASKSYSRSRSSIGQLMWPANLINAFDYLQIEIVNFVPISQALASTPPNTTTPSNPTPANAVATTPRSGLIDGGISNVQTSSTEKAIATILLPVPENLNYTDSLNWQEDKIGVINKLMPALARNLVEGDVEGMTSSVQDLAKGGKVGEIVKILNDMSLNSGAITQGIGGKVLNPYTEQVFGGIGMRNFELNWKLVPRSQNEQIAIHDLIKVLRKNSLPDYAANLTSPGQEGQSASESQSSDPIDALSDRWLTVPKIFRLSWRTIGGGELISLPKIKPCVLKNVQVSYTPNNVWATHMVNNKDPYPVAYDLSLSFGETEIITGKDVDLGF
jgi:hypothetical protein